LESIFSFNVFVCFPNKERNSLREETIPTFRVYASEELDFLAPHTNEEVIVMNWKSTIILVSWFAVIPVSIHYPPELAINSTC
jgi:hypothetical protein